MTTPSVRNRDAALFGAVVNRLRRERGWTLVKLAQRTGMNPTYLGVLEKGGNMPTLATVLELADVLNIEASEMIRRLEEARRRARASRTAAAAAGAGADAE